LAWLDAYTIFYVFIFNVKLYNINTDIIIHLALLEESKTVGQAVRSLIEFPKPPEADPDAECNSEKGSKHGEGGRRNSIAPAHNSKKEVPPKVELHPKVELPPSEPLPPPPRHWFNTVMYGVPNILFTQTKTV
jgi:hypothetical protein